MDFYSIRTNDINKVLISLVEITNKTKRIPMRIVNQIESRMKRCADVQHLFAVIVVICLKYTTHTTVSGIVAFANICICIV